MGRVCNGPSLLWTDLAMGRDMPDQGKPKFGTELGSVSAHLFQQYLRKNEIPRYWSCPLYQKGDKDQVHKYRPYSLTCVPRKLLEQIVCCNIMINR